MAISWVNLSCRGWTDGDYLHVRNAVRARLIDREDIQQFLAVDPQLGSRRVLGGSLA